MKVVSPVVQRTTTSQKTTRTMQIIQREQLHSMEWLIRNILYTTILEVTSGSVCSAGQCSVLLSYTMTQPIILQIKILTRSVSSLWISGQHGQLQKLTSRRATNGLSQKMQLEQRQKNLQNTRFLEHLSGRVSQIHGQVNM